MERPYPTPAVRRLRVYAFDPQASTRPDTAALNVATIELPWEPGWEDPLLAGPVNEYFEIIDVDPISDQFYDPIDLNDPFLLAQDGLAPTEGDPRFHQQMVFAVAMRTVRVFERALGRKVFWSPRKLADGTYERVRKLRVYPHALREPNAYYSPEKKALLFGYFRTSAAREAGATWVFTALSHDIIVHETTHAILDGLHRRYAEATSVDSLAFHEAFADIIALLAHFSLRDAVRSEIAAHGGSLDTRTLMSGLAKQFGHATGRAGPLREAVDTKLEGGLPDPELLDTVTEAHDRGAILVAAVFEAFLTIYRRRTADLLRIAGVGVAAQGQDNLHPDLVNRLTHEAVKSADQVMRMCIRALDYLPPVDVRLGEFLRAIVTADTDLVPDDPMGYRLAMIEAFRRRGIVAENCLSLAPDSLLWESPRDPRLTIKTVTQANGRVSAGLEDSIDLLPKYKRTEAMDAESRNCANTHEWLLRPEGDELDLVWQDACGVLFRPGLQKDDDRPTVLRSASGGWGAKVEVHSVRTTRRAGPDGQDLRQLIVEVAQRRRGFLKAEDQAEQDGAPAAERPGDFTFRGGATLIFDLRDGVLRYAIRKRICDDKRLVEQREFLKRQASGGLGFTYSRAEPGAATREPFALAHRGG